MRKDPAYRDFVDRLRDVGYNINLDRDKRVFCPGYGIPQKRRRWVALASKRGSLNLGSPTRTDESEYVSVREAIGHLEPLQAGKTDPDDWLHTTRPLSETNLKRVRASVPGGTWRDWDEDLMLECHKNEKGSTFASVYGRMVPDEPAPTITTQFYNLGSGRFGHYDEEQDRALSLREGAILQTFPDEYAFAEEFEDLGMTKFGQMIGNAVPPDLGEVIGRRVRDFVAGVDRQQALSDYHDS